MAFKVPFSPWIKDKQQGTPPAGGTPQEVTPGQAAQQTTATGTIATPPSGGNDNIPPNAGIFPPEPPPSNRDDIEMPPPATSEPGTQASTPPPAAKPPETTLTAALDDVKKREGELNLGDTPGGVSERVNLTTAKWLLDMYADIYCLFLRNYAKIDKKMVFEAILNGYLSKSYLDMIESANKKAEENIVFTEAQKEFVLNPLKEFITIHKIKIPPGIQVIIGLLFISLSTFIVANEIRKDNEYMLKNIILQSQKARENMSTHEPDVQTVHAEVVPASDTSTTPPADTYVPPPSG